MNKIIFMAGLVLCLSATMFSQPRPAEKATTPAAAKKQAPQVFGAKYEGGLFGYNKKEAGTLKFDDANERLVFIGKEQKEMFGIPYKSVLIVSPQSKSVTSTAGNVVRHIPLPGAFLAGFIKEKRRYLVLQFDDPDVDAKGVVNFKIENKELLDAVIDTIGAKAKLMQRGDAYYRPRTVKGEI